MSNIYFTRQKYHTENFDESTWLGIKIYHYKKWSLISNFMALEQELYSTRNLVNIFVKITLFNFLVFQVNPFHNIWNSGHIRKIHYIWIRGRYKYKLYLYFYFNGFNCLSWSKIVSLSFCGRSNLGYINNKIKALSAIDSAFEVW